MNLHHNITGDKVLTIVKELFNRLKKKKRKSI